MPAGSAGALAGTQAYNGLTASQYGQYLYSPDTYGGGTGALRDDIDYRYTVSTIGDSLTTSDRLQSVLYDRLNNPNFTFRSIPGNTQVLEHGMPGGTTGSILAAAQSRDLGYGEDANFVIIMADTNDIDYSRHDNIQDLATAMVSNIQAMVDSVLGGQTDPSTRPAVIVMGIPCYTDSDWTSRAKVYKDMLHSSLKHIDVFSDANWYDLYDSGSKAANTSFMEDVKHPNGDGYYRIAENWFEGVDALFNPARFSQKDSHLYKGDWYFQRK